jgi:hypothetical protein
MSRNGSGVYSLPAGNPVVTGTTISSTWANTTLTDLATAMTGSVASDGQTPMTNSLNMSNNKIISVTDPTNDQDAATKIYTDTAIATATSGLGATYLTKANNLSDVANATTSRTNLVAAKSGANSDITSITGLTTALTVAQGGTGAATLTANNVLLGNGTSALQAVAPSTAGKILVSNGTTWTSNTIAASGIKLGLGITGEVWNDVSGSRSSGTTYTNSRAYPISVSVFETTNTSAYLYVSGILIAGYTGSSSDATMTAIVPAGATYSATFGGVNAFVELY